MTTTRKAYIRAVRHLEIVPTLLLQLLLLITCRWSGPKLNPTLGLETQQDHHGQPATVTGLKGSLACEPSIYIILQKPVATNQLATVTFIPFSQVQIKSGKIFIKEQIISSETHSLEVYRFNKEYGQYLKLTQATHLTLLKCLKTNKHLFKRSSFPFMIKRFYDVSNTLFVNLYHFKL